MADTANVQSLTQQASGSVGGVIFSHNQHGPYFRTRTVPLDPGTSRQIAVRNALSQCVTAWNATLTQAEREAWDRYASALRQPSPIGRQTNAGGLGMYVHSNVPRLQAGEGSVSRVDVAPSLFDLGPFTLPRPILLDAAPDDLQVWFTDTDAWTTEDGSAMLFWASPPVPATVNFYKGPYRYAGCILGNSGSPPTSPANIPLPFPADPGDRIHVRGRVTRVDGRTSSSFRLHTTGPAIQGPVPINVNYYHSPYFQAYVFFDQAIDAGMLDNPNWTLRWSNYRYQASAAQAFTSYLRFSTTSPLPDAGANIVDFAPPPFDVVSTDTGMPAAAFTDYPIT